LSGGPVGRFFTFHFADATQIIGGKISAAGREVFIFNTHWHASPFPTKEYLKLLSERFTKMEIDQSQYDKLLEEAVEGQKWRLDDANKTIAFIDNIAEDYPVILMGDFNALADSEEINVLKASGFQDAYTKAGNPPGFTWDGYIDGNIQLQKEMYPEDFWLEPTQKRIDFIFFKGSGLQVLTGKVVLDRPYQGIYPSDHFGVMAEFEVQVIPKTAK